MELTKYALNSGYITMPSLKLQDINKTLKNNNNIRSNNIY